MSQQLAPQHLAKDKPVIPKISIPMANGANILLIIFSTSFNVSVISLPF